MISAALIEKLVSYFPTVVHVEKIDPFEREGDDFPL